LSLTSLPISGNRGNYMNNLNIRNIADQITIDSRVGEWIQSLRWKDCMWCLCVSH